MAITFLVSMLRLLQQGLLFVSLTLSGSLALAGTTTVFAAASLKNALEAIRDQYQQKFDNRIVLSFGGSSMLARQIEYGAPADIFISANIDWMDRLARNDLIHSGSRMDLVGNRLVLISRDPSAERVQIDSRLDLRAMLSGQQKLAMAMVDAVPAGIYGKSALTHLKLWDSVVDRVVQTDNVRAALMLVASGEAALGIVYASDVGSTDAVGRVGEFPSNSHPEIRYPAAVTAKSVGGQARHFLAYLQSPDALRIFARHGFEILSGKNSG